MYKRIVTGALVFGLAAMAPPALSAQGNCAARTHVVERLKNLYEEQLSGAGLQTSQQVIEVWSSPESGSWTILLTRPDGQSCVLAAGSDWHQILATADASETPA